MNGLIKEKIDRVEALYPKERIDRSKERLNSLWNRQTPDDRYPFTFAPATYDTCGDLHMPEQRVMAALDELINKGRFGDDAIPSIFPGCRQSTMPNLFGAKELVIGNDCTCEKIINKPGDIDSLTWEIKKGTVAYNWLEFQKQAIELTDGRLPVHVVDMQGPFDACAQLCGYDHLMLCAFEEPERYRRLMTMMSDAFCTFWEEQQKVCGDLFMGTHLLGWSYIPPMKCATVSMDSLVMLSPDFWYEFVEPYFGTIKERLGRVVVHSCGDFSQMVPVLMEDENIIAINAGQMTVEELLAAGVNNNKVLIVACAEADAEKTIRQSKENGLFTDISIWASTLSFLTNKNDPGFAENERKFKAYTNELLSAATY